MRKHLSLIGVLLLLRVDTGAIYKNHAKTPAITLSFTKRSPSLLIRPIRFDAD